MKRNNPRHPGRLLLLFSAVACILLPVGLIVLWAAARRWPWPGLLPDGFSARGIAELFGERSQTLGILASSVAFSLLAAVLSVIVGFLSARAFALYTFRGKALLRFCGMLPILIPANGFAMGIHVLFIRWGLADQWAGVLICHVLYAVPYTLSLLSDSMEALGTAYEQQAAVLGCPPGRILFHITLPLLLPSLLSALSMAYILSFSQYFLTLLIGGGVVKTFSVIMVPFIAGGDRTIASAYVLLFLLSSLPVFALFEALARASTAGRSRKRDNFKNIRLKQKRRSQ